MNEALKPEVAERLAPAPVPAFDRPASRRRRRFEPPPRRNLVAAHHDPWRSRRPCDLRLAIDRKARDVADRGREVGPSTPPQTVRIAPVVTGDMPITLDALGTVTPFETVTIKTQIAGTLMELGFTEGQMVKKGDFIAQIDPRPYQAALAQAQGQLAKDQALLAQAESDLDRYETLNKQDSISKQQVTDQQALVAQDKAAISDRSGGRPDRPAQPELHPHRVADHRTRRYFGSSTPGTISSRRTRPASSSSPRLDPISVIFPTAEDNLSAHLKTSRFRRHGSGDRVQPRQCRQAGRGHADHLRQPGRHHDRHDQDARDVRQSERRPCFRSSSSTCGF